MFIAFSVPSSILDDIFDFMFSIIFAQFLLLLLTSNKFVTVV